MLTLGVDFCGTIMSHTSGWQGSTVIEDPPVPGAIEWLLKASEHFTIAITSGRFRRAETRATAQRMVRDWLVEHGVPYPWITVDPIWSGRIVLALFRPSCHVTLDDRAIQFTGTFPDPVELLAFQPWNKREANPSEPSLPSTQE